ncbi:hypothetical protein TRFO_10302 [Tritrichomonas foetus]|uniref:FERM domain-containing protein n=1 Tax=Tritrichomonas foetus TaxID=1144522 RepID=A0A1J4J9L7_9EUKA|nr:hypothetical protein TRFO_10302 [Tritrichomonas foetus]|eukprot:OHS95890.1 hypothetical protein TRFO_10302 [Tritrichomonas foetus]
MIQPEKTNLGLEAELFGSNQRVNTTIPSTLKGSEIKNFLTFSHSMQLPENSCIVLKIPMDRAGKRIVYHIIDDDKDMTRFVGRRSNVKILIYPKSIRLRIHCADGRVSTRDYPAKTPANQIIEQVCNDFFHLKHHIAYALYGDKNDLQNPISATKSILEYDPYIQDVWLLRRFWIKACSTLTDESDIHFNYSHARNIVFASNFNYKYYKWEDLIAISLTIEYSTYEQTKVLLKKEKKEKKIQQKVEKKKEKKEKKEKKKEKKKKKKAIKAGIAVEEPVEQTPVNTGPSPQDLSHFPKWMLDDKKLKKRKNDVIEKVKNYEGKDILGLKLDFMNLCLENKFFGALMFHVRCPIPMTGQAPADYVLSFTEEQIHLLEPGTETDVFKIEHPLVKKWKPTSFENLSFFFYPNATSKNLIQWNIQYDNVLFILDYFTSLVNFIKQQEILAMKDEQRKIYLKERQRQTQSSLNDILTNNDIEIGYQMDDDLDDLYQQGDLQNDVLNRFPAPAHQTPVFLDVTKITAFLESQNTYEELKNFYDDERGFRYEPEEYHAVNESIIESGCALLRSIILQESISPIADATAWVQSVLPEDLLTQSVLGWQLQGPANNLNEAVSTISRCISYVFQSELSPLDSFVALNYARSLLMHFARQQWKEIDFVEMAEQVDEYLGAVLRPVFNITRRLIYPLSTLVLEDSSDILPDARSMLFLNESIGMTLTFAAISVARALCDAGIGCEDLQPILNTLPVVNTYDPIVAYRLSDALMPLLSALETNEVAQKALLAQAHAAKVEVSNMVNCVTELYSFTHFLPSPVAVYCQAHSPRLLTLPETPSTIPEAAYIYQLARESSLTLWNLNDGRYASLAQQISYTAAEFYTLFIEAARDPSLTNSLGYTFQQLIEALSRAIEIFQTTTSIINVLNPDDPSHAVLLNLLNSPEDSRTSLSLLALDSVSPKHKLAVLEDSGQRIDTQLRSINGICSEEEIQLISDSFRVFSLMVLALSKDQDNASQIRVDISKFGEELIDLMKANIDEDTRRRRVQELITRLRTFINIGKTYQEFKLININTAALQVKQRNITIVNEAARIRDTTNEFAVQLLLPDSSVSTETLQKIAAILRRFSLAAMD